MDCPEEAQLVRFVHGEFAAEEVSLFESHLDGCERCLALIADAAESSRSPSPGGTESGPRTDGAFVHLIAALARRSEDAPDSRPARLRFGPYRVLGEIGRGAMGRVYRAVDDTTGLHVAIKTVVRPSPKILSALRQEIAFLEQKTHPGIVRAYEKGVLEGDPWYAMELLSGVTLAGFNHRLWLGHHPDRGPRSWGTSPVAGAPSEPPPAAAGRLEEVLTLFARMCSPLAFIHRQGVVHCDLKPENIFVRGEGDPVLMDFGLLSRAGGTIGRETLEVGGQIRGTLPYLAPELVRGQIPDARADLYALGCIMYETVTGRPPFLASTVDGFLEAHLRVEPLPASRLATGVPPELDEVFSLLLAKGTAQRIGTAEVVAERLSALLPARDATPISSQPAAPHLFRPRMVGRDATIELLSSCLDDAKHGRGRVVLVSGESGIGKTFLASEVAQRAARAGFEVVTGECAPVAATAGAGNDVVGAALAPFKRLLQFAGDSCRGGSPELAVDLLGSSRNIALFARYEPTLSHLVDPATPDVLAPLPPTAERERVLQAMADLLERLTAEIPLLLVIDDLQWADDLSLALLDLLAESDLAGRRLLVLATYRSEEVGKAISDLEGRERVRGVRLERLDAWALKSLVGDLLSDRPPEAFIHALAVHSEGNPFFVAEYLRAGVTEGLLRRTAEGWRPAGPAAARGYEDLSLPASLQVLLDRRLAALPIEAQRATEAAAVLGRQSSVAMIASVADMGAGAVQAAIEPMLARQVVERVPGEGLRFLHDKLREAAYGRLAADRRVALHLAAANVLEATYANTPALPSHYAELAYHLRQSGQTARAVDYFEKAGEHALRASADADAVRYFHEANELARGAVPVSSARRASWARMTGDALYGLGDLGAATRHLKDAVDLLGWRMPARRSASVLCVVAKLGQQAVHRSVPRGWIEAPAEKSAAHLEAARAYARLEQIHYFRGEYLPLFVANLSSLNLSERARPSSHLAAAYTNAGAAAGLMPLRKVASKYFALAEAMLEKAYDAEVESYLRLGHAVYLAGLGQWDGAVASCARGLELASGLGFRRRWEELAAVRALATCDFDERMEWGRKTAESALRRSDPQTATWGLLNQAELSAARGDLARARDLVAQAEPLLSRVGLPEQISALACRAVLAVAEGDAAAAGSLADRAAALVKRTRPMQFGNIDAYGRIAEVQLAVWSASRGRSRAGRGARARAACSDLATASRIFPIALPSYCLHEGLLRWTSGRAAQAVALWERGVGEARRLGLSFREAQLLTTLAQHRPGGAGAAEARAAAAKLAGRLGVADASHWGSRAPVRSRDKHRS